MLVFYWLHFPTYSAPRVKIRKYLSIRKCKKILFFYFITVVFDKKMFPCYFLCFQISGNNQYITNTIKKITMYNYLL